MQPSYAAPVVLAGLRSIRSHPIASTWETEFATIASAVNGILSITHRSLFLGALDVQDNLRSKPEFMNSMSSWPSVFSGVSIIANRQTPRHRDRQTWPTWYDIVVTAGSYADGDFEISPIGLRCRYKPGTVVALCGNLLEHACETAGGDRVCLAFFMRSSLFELTGVEMPNWSTMCELMEEA